MGSTRREVLAGLLGLGAASLGCSDRDPEVEITVVGPSMDLGHKLRDASFPLATSKEEIPVAIVGGGVSGLAAAWRLAKAGRAFRLFELEPEVGGTAAGTRFGGIPCPTAAHYLVAPRRDQTRLVELLDELGIVDGYDASGEPIYSERHLVFDPEERVYHRGYWHEGLIPMDGATASDRADLARFEAMIGDFVATRGDDGLRAFDLPLDRSSRDPKLTALDQMSMQEWMRKNRFSTHVLNRSVEYATLDDFGASPEEVSAWAGIHYFASRVQSRGMESAPFLTWPDGNGFLVRSLHEKVAKSVVTGHVVTRIEPLGDGRRASISCWDVRQQASLGYIAEKVIVAVPGYVRARLIHGYRKSEWMPQQAPWMVANLFLRERPMSRGFPEAWDNALWDSKSLGYSVATHQNLHPTTSTVWTYYLPLPGDPHKRRSELLAADPRDVVAGILADLRRAHMGLDRVATHVQVRKLGHGMPRPEPGFLTHPARLAASTPDGPLHFAHTDLSGLALFEEAFSHGVRAAEEVLSS